MTTEIRVPTLGELVTEATIGRWFKKPGEAVAIDEPLVELETDKVTVEVPAPAAGVLSEVLVNPGDTVGVGAVLGLLQEGAGGAKLAARPEPAAAPAPARAGSRASAGRGAADRRQWPGGAPPRRRERHQSRHCSRHRPRRPRHQGRHAHGRGGARSAPLPPRTGARARRADQGARARRARRRRARGARADDASCARPSRGG